MSIEDWAPVNESIAEAAGHVVRTSVHRKEDEICSYRGGGVVGSPQIGEEVN